MKKKEFRTEEILNVLVTGIAFGYSSCCVKDFAIDYCGIQTLNHKNNKLDGTGSLACDTCNESELNVEDLKEIIISQRHKSLPQTIDIPIPYLSYEVIDDTLSKKIDGIEFIEYFKDIVQTIKNKFTQKRLIEPDKWIIYDDLNLESLSSTKLLEKLSKSFKRRGNVIKYCIDNFDVKNTKENIEKLQLSLYQQIKFLVPNHSIIDIDKILKEDIGYKYKNKELVRSLFKKII